MSIKISKATIDDGFTIRELAHAIWPPTFAEILSPEQIQYMLEMMYSETAIKYQIAVLNHLFLLAYENNKAVGYISFELNYKNGSITKIHKIYLLPETQGKGVGVLLMKEVEKRAIEKSQKALTLNVNKYNKALQFYHKLGYKTIGREDIDIGNGFLMEDAILKKDI
jgi:GNAT superfamily N-acetyltransferase